MNRNLPFHNLTNLQLLNEIEGFTRYNVPLRYSAYSDLEFNHTKFNNYMNEYDPDYNLLQNYPANQPSLHCSILDLAHKIIRTKERNLSVLFNNICSFKENFDNFESLYLTHIKSCFHVLGFCETRMDKDTEALYQLPGYNLFAMHNTSRNGGVCMFINRTIAADRVDEFCISFDHFESVFINPRTLTMGVICPFRHLELIEHEIRLAF